MTKPHRTDLHDKAGSNAGAGISRRTWLGGAALTMAVGATFIMPIRAEAKTAQKDAQYQDSPKDGNKCSGCSQFEAPDACKLVEGKISENGWCQLYSPKG